MKPALAAVALALALLSPSAAAALDDETALSDRRASARVVDISVSGDAAALARVRMTARELLRRLDVHANVRSSDELEARPEEPFPLVIAHVDLRDPSTPGVIIEDGRTRQELTRRRLSRVATLETGVESLLHVVYLAVESSLQVAAAPRPDVAAPKKPQPAPPPRAPRDPVRARSNAGLDVGPLFRLSSLGGARYLPGGGVVLEPRADLGRAQLSVPVSGVVHASSELSFAGGTVDVRPLQARVVPTLDWLFTPSISGCLGLGGGVDAFTTEPLQPPPTGRAVAGGSAIDPVLTGAIGGRVAVAGRAFVTALASLDLDLRPTAFVARVGVASENVMRLPRVRAGFTLALSFSTIGSRRFVAKDVTEQ